MWNILKSMNLFQKFFSGLRSIKASQCETAFQWHSIPYTRPESIWDTGEVLTRWMSYYHPSFDGENIWIGSGLLGIQRTLLHSWRQGRIWIPSGPYTPQHGSFGMATAAGRLKMLSGCLRCSDTSHSGPLRGQASHSHLSMRNSHHRRLGIRLLYSSLHWNNMINHPISYISIKW